MRTITTLTAACALAVSLSACGPEAEDAGGKAGKGSAPASPSPARTLTLAEVSGAVAKQLAADKTVRVTGGGVSRGEKVQINMVIGTAAGRPEYDMTVDAPAKDGKTGRVQMLLLKDAFYLRIDGDEIEPGKPWARVGADSKNPLAKIFMVMGSTMKNSVDPQQQQLTADAGGRLTGARPEKVGGVDATRYTVAVDMTRAIQKVDLRKYLADTAGQLAQVPGLDAATKAKADKAANLSDADLEKLRANMLKAVRGSTATTDFWLDGSGRPLKQATEVVGGAQAQKMELTYSDWGKAALTVPPPGQVTEMPDMPKMP
ncbi:hypothetical protein [Actinomadura hibisca]|uniref:hypothetical protein n=1 Tax=Actinomadura hibisca TaxID=68565 RepID=UPI000833389B|nr:hypothetical protein [Actinomadura hibisca]